MDWKTRLPGLSGDSDMDMKRVLDYSFQLSEEIRYYLNNLDMSNFNQVEWATYENGLLQIVAEGVTVLISDAEKRLSVQWKADIEGFSATVEQYGETVDGYTKEVNSYKQHVSSYQQTVNGFNTTVRSYEQTLSGYKDQVSSYEQTASKIALMVSSVDDVNGNVTAASIVAAINAAGSSVKISADHVNISGFVTVSDLEGEGTVEINAGNIAAGGTISGVALESSGYNDSKKVSVHDGMVDFYSGYIMDSDVGVLTMYANDMLRFDTDGTFRFYLSSGRYWELDGNGMNYYTASGSYINGFQFAN